MKKAIIITLSVLLGVVVALGAAAVILFGGTYRTLRSFERLDGDMYSIRCTDNYWLDEYLEQGGEKGDTLTEFLPKKLTRGIGFLEDLTATSGYSCSAFLARNEKGEIIVGRNFDWQYTPSVVLTTDTGDGYRSIGVANAAMLGFTGYSMPESGLSAQGITLLGLPYVTADGMNEKGVTACVLSVPTDTAPAPEGAPALSAMSMIRLALDKAASVDEAVELISGCAVTNPQANDFHLFIADRTGKAVVVEYHDGMMDVIDLAESLPAVTNFYLFEENGEGSGQDRYAAIRSALTGNAGVLTEQQALELLVKVGAPNWTQWSALYNLTTGEVCVFPGYDLERLRRFELKMD